MAHSSSSPAQQVLPVLPLSKSESEQLLDSLWLADSFERHDGSRLAEAFWNLSPDTHHLLRRNMETDRISEGFVHLWLDFLCSIIDTKWDESGKYESLDQAITLFDARMFSSLLVLENLGSSLESLNQPVHSHYAWAEMVVNALVGSGVDGAYPDASVYRLSTMEELAHVTALTTYVAVDAFIHQGKTDDQVLVEKTTHHYPRESETEGIVCYNFKVNHPELELRLRGKNLSEYETVMRFARDRGIGTSVEEIDFVLSQVDSISAPLLLGAL